MKQNFTCHLKTTILAIIFLLSGGIPANSQVMLFGQNEVNTVLEEGKTDVSGLVPPFYLFYQDGTGGFWVTGNEYTLSKRSTTISIANRQPEYNGIPDNALKLNIDENVSSRILCCNLDLENNTVTIAVHDMSLTEQVPATCTTDGYKNTSAPLVMKKARRALMR